MFLCAVSVFTCVYVSDSCCCVGQAWGTYWTVFRGGIFWFLLPASLIVCNDIWAYFTGLMFGKRFIARQFLALRYDHTCTLTFLCSLYLVF